jgi:hypothetical protein
MSYDYKETAEEIIIDKGIATREMWKEYEHGQEHVSYEELVKAVKLRDRVPLVHDSEHNHTEPLTDASRALGYAVLKPCPTKKGLRVLWHFDKRRCPVSLLTRLRQKETLPVSIFQFTNVDETGEQRDLLFDHIAILTDQEPRCPIERCGVGVYDSKMTDDEKIPVDPKGTGNLTAEDHKAALAASTEPVPTVHEETKEPPLPKEPVAPTPPDDTTKDQLISDLQAQLAKRDAQITKIREPLVSELQQRGYQAQELNPLSIDTLQKMVSQSRAAATEGLPGTVPAPSSEAPKSLPELREAEQQRFEESLKKRQKERFGDW